MVDKCDFLTIIYSLLLKWESCAEHSNSRWQIVADLPSCVAITVIHQSRSTCGLGAKIEKSDPNEEWRVASVWEALYETKDFVMGWRGRKDTCLNWKAQLWRTRLRVQLFWVQRDFYAEPMTFWLCDRVVYAAQSTCFRSFMRYAKNCSRRFDL